MTSEAVGSQTTSPYTTDQHTVGNLPIFYFFISKFSFSFIKTDLDSGMKKLQNIYKDQEKL